MVESTCEWCGDDFTYYPSNSSGRFCSNDCHSEYRRSDENDRKVKLECTECGEIYHKLPSNINDGKQFCSRDCLYAHRRETSAETKQAYCNICDREFTSHRGYRMHETSVHAGERGSLKDGYCPECEFHSPENTELAQHHRTEHFDGNAASETQCPECGLTFESRKALKTHFGHVHDGTLRPSKDCLNCGELFHHIPSADKFYANEFCSAACNYEYGRGGKGVERVRRILTPDGTHWEEIAYEVREAANGRCEMCGDECETHAKGGLQTHHVIPMRSGGTHADWNLWALCPSCHGKAESAALELFDIHLWNGTQAPTVRSRNGKGQFEPMTQ